MTGASNDILFQSDTIRVVFILGKLQELIIIAAYVKVVMYIFILYFDVLCA